MANRRYEPWTNERIDELIKDRSLTRIGEVTYWNIKVNIECQVCGNEFEAYPQNLERGTGCPSCYKENKKGSRRKAKWTLKEVKKFSEENGYVCLSDEYLNSREPMLWLDKETNQEFIIPFRSLQTRVKTKLNLINILKKAETEKNKTK